MALDLAAVPAPETPGADGAARSRLPAGGCEESEAAATGPHWLVPPAVEPGRRAAPNSTENSAGAARAAAAEHEARHGGGGAQPHADGDPAPSAAAADRAAAAAAGDAALASDATGETAAAAVAVLAAPEPMAVDPAEASADVAQAQAARRAWAAAAAARPAARAAAAAAAAAPGACPRQPPPRPPLVVPATALAYIGRVQRALRLGAFLATASGQRWPPAPPAPPLLPPPAPGAPPPLLTVLFDLDGTLVLRVQRPPWPGGGAAARAAFRGWGGARDVVVRPKAAAFLSACASRGWRLAVFTAASEGYARDVLASLLDPSGALFGGEGEGAEGTDGEGEGAPSPRPLLLLSWSSVTRLPCGDGGYLRGEDGKPYESYAKDVAAAGAGAAAVLVDDTPRVAALSPHSVLLVRPWDGADGGDDELMGRALPLLDACAAAEAAGAAAAAAAAAGAGGGDGGAAAFRPGDGVAAVLRARFGLRERGERAAEAAERARGARCAAAADRARMHLLLLRLRQQQREAAAAAGGAKRPRRAPLAAPPPAISGDGEAAPFAFVDPSPREVCAAAARAPFSPFSPEELRWEGWRAAPPGGGAAAAAAAGRGGGCGGGWWCGAGAPPWLRRLLPAPPPLFCCDLLAALNRARRLARAVRACGGRGGGGGRRAAAVPPLPVPSPQLPCGAGAAGAASPPRLAAELAAAARCVVGSPAGECRGAAGGKKAAMTAFALQQQHQPAPIAVGSQPLLSVTSPPQQQLLWVAAAVAAGGAEVAWRG